MIITITDRPGAESLTLNVGVVISITDPSSPLIEFSVPVHRWQFMDVTHGGGYYRGPDEQIARQIADVIRSLDTPRLVVHCEYGRSRSAAVALAAKIYHGAELEPRAGLTPNGLLCRLLDDELGLNGALVVEGIRLNSEDCY